MKSFPRLYKWPLLLGVFFLLPFTSGAWGLLGHRIVGEVAEAYLTAKTRRALQAILGFESVAMASNWGDFIKSDSTFNYLDPWHYVNIQGGLGKTAFLAELNRDTGVNLYKQVNMLAGELKKKNLPPAQKLFYLRLLIHFVGDMHQPMHVGRREDLGGNRVRVQWFNQPSNLHRVWDSDFIDFQQLSYTEYARAINHPPRAQVVLWQKSPVSDWIYESYDITNRLYAEITQPDQKLSYNYNFDHLATLNQRLLQGGVRLAGLLNSIFGG